MKYITIIAITFLYFSCSFVSIPDGLKPVDNFEIKKYLGKWYEIARIDNRFEKNLIKKTAIYSLNDDGTIKVLNRGYNIVDKEWKEYERKAKFVQKRSLGRLKVSFFGPFYRGYNIIDIDKKGYEWSIASGPNRDYLWILSRKPRINDNLLMELLLKVEDFGYKTEDLIFVGN
ncbi:MAG: lipocalin [Candidatus Cloacimonadota bacterium]|nr:MAG: lipocalin [Candidatus Cloacimonadota bacterium]PIE80174.1 MAG: lipocalin [Candidatus Delongbacteria bacterium]